MVLAGSEMCMFSFSVQKSEGKTLHEYFYMFKTVVFTKDKRGVRTES